MIIDSHNHIGTRKGEHFPVENIIEWIDAANVDACVVTTHPEAIDNDYVANAQKEYSDRILGFAVVNPWDFGAEEELERSFKELNLRGLKLNTLRHGYALDRHEIVDPLFEICEKYNAPVLCHGESDLFNMPGKFEVMAQKFPNVNIILAHIGEPDAVDAALRVANRNENIYVDTAGIKLDTLVKAIDRLDSKKILMGTDAPWGKFELSKKLVERATDDKVIQGNIMGKNISRLLSLKH